jgi:micrococcal nuclease
MEKGLGLWRMDLKKKGKIYLGNRKTFRFHFPGCPFAKKIAKTNGIRFSSEYDAFWEGYSPCRRCRP